MKFKMKLSIALVISLLLAACDSGGSKPAKMVKVWKVAKEVKTDSNGTVTDSSTNFYDNNGLLYKEVLSVEDGYERYKEYTYKEGVISKIERFRRILTSPSLAFTSIEVIAMDEHGTVLTQANPSFTNTYVNKYHTDGRLLKRTRDSSFSTVVDYVMDYVYKGNTVEVMITRLSDGRKTLKKYNYDSKGNLLSRASHDVNTDALIGQNSYKYYDDSDGNVDRQTYDRKDNGIVDWTKTYTWVEFDVIEKYANRVLKGCTVKQGGCEGGRSDRAALPVMSYGK